MKQAFISGAAMLMSVVVHTWVMAGSSRQHVLTRLPVPPTVVSFSVAPAPPPAATVEPAPPPPAAPKPTKKPKPKPEPPSIAEPHEAVVEAVEPSREAPAELTGHTLTSDAGQGFSVPAGNGDARQGAIQTGIKRPAVNVPQTVSAVARKEAPRTASQPSAVPLAELSRRPEPPPLTQALERNYPSEARRIGRSGEAKVRARVEATGMIRVVTITSETAVGFGTACRDTVLGSKWSAPLDHSGRPAITWVTYRCKFRIER